MLNPGLTSVTFRRFEAEKIIDFCKCCGLSCIEWGGDIHIPPGKTKRAAEIRKKTEDAGLFVASYGSYYRSGAKGSTAGLFKSCLETAAALGAPLIRLWSGDRGSAEADEKYFESICRETQVLCDMAAEYNIDIAYEYHSYSLTDNAESVLKLYEKTDRKNFGTYFQYDPKISIEENFSSLKKLLPILKAVHIFNIDEKENRLSVAEENGIKIWSGLLEILEGCGKSVPLMFEFLKNESLEGLKKETEIFNKISEREKI